MANSKSAEKRARQTIVRTERNRVLKSRIRTSRRRLDEALEKGDAEGIKLAVGNVTSAADRAVKVGVIHKNAASRIKSRVTKAAAAKA